MIKAKSAKAKGRKLEKWIEDRMTNLGLMARRQPGSGAFDAFPHDVEAVLPDGTRVLKLVFSFFGRESNRDEARAWREASPAMRAHLVPVLAADPMGSWLVMERVKPLRSTQHIPRETMDALKGCGFLDLRRPNFAADGRLLDYGAMLFWRQEAGCRAEGSAAREGSGSVRPRRRP